MKPASAMAAIKDTVKKTVTMGQTVIVKNGNVAKFNSGPLTVCSVCVFQVVHNNKVVATGMTHRGYESSDHYRNELQAALAKNGYSNKRAFRIRLVAVQTAPNTQINSQPQAQDLHGIPVGVHNCTLVALAQDMSAEVTIDDGKSLEEMAEYAPSKGLMVTESSAYADGTGDINVTRAPPSRCTIM